MNEPQMTKFSVDRISVYFQRIRMAKVLAEDEDYCESALIIPCYYQEILVIT